MNNENAVKTAFTHIKVVNAYMRGLNDLIEKIAGECGITTDEVCDHIEAALASADEEEMKS